MLNIAHKDDFQIFHCKVDSEDGLLQIHTSLQDRIEKKGYDDKQGWDAKMIISINAGFMGSIL